MPAQQILVSTEVPVPIIVHQISLSLVHALSAGRDQIAHKVSLGMKEGDYGIGVWM